MDLHAVRRHRYEGTLMSVKRSTPAPTGGLAMTLASFVWNGREIAIPSETDMASVFGPPERFSNLSPNSILTWDSLGLYAYLENQSKHIISMAVAIRMTEKQNEFRPKAPFSGEIALPFVTIRPDTTRDELLSLGFRADFGTHLSKVGETAGFWAEFDAAGKELVDFQLCRKE